jgi:hypothetical protein
MTGHAQCPVQRTETSYMANAAGGRQGSACPRQRADRSIDCTVSLMRILAGLWYGWQTMREEDGAPRFSPIRICSATLALHDGLVVDLKFLIPTFSRSVTLSREHLGLLCPADDYLVARLRPRLRSRRVAIVSELTPEWLARCCPAIALELGLSVSRLGLQQALDTMFTVH